MVESESKDQGSPDQQKVRLATIWSSWQISANLLSAYLGILAVDLGATGLEQSMVSGVQTLGNASLQSVWGNLADRFGRRPFLFLGLLAIGMTAAFMPFAPNAITLIILLLVPTVIGSAAIPAWNGILGDLTTIKARGRFIGTIQVIGTIASAVALIVVGYFAINIGIITFAEHQLPFLVAAASIFIAIICVLCLRETLHREKDVTNGFRKVIAATPHFSHFLLVNAVFFLVMGAAWPLFPVVTRGILLADDFQIALLTALFILCSGAAQILGGLLTDRFGRKPILFISRFLIFLAPLSHMLGAVTLNIWFLVPSNIAGGVLTGFFVVSSTSWLLDSSPGEIRSSVVAVYNVVSGVTSFIGAIITGFIADFLSLSMGYFSAVILLLFVIIFLRILVSTSYLTVNETLVKN
jgi:MFS family permease